ncbi:MAG: Holliday junction branch migration protein RuvA [Clostridia bacterium]|nr:Holliday junction branch migration protein RuvA [Clostridia bacterium]
MISLLRGMLYKKTESKIFIDVGGIGFGVFLGMDEIPALETGSEVTVHTYLNVRDDAMDLYGFISSQRLSLFESLLFVGGIGPRTALPITTAISLDNFRKSIITEDIDRLRELPGVGKKTAQKMILELKDRFKKEVDLVIPPSGFDVNDIYLEAKGALEGLGFSPSEVEIHLREALQNFDKGAQSEDLVKYVLRNVGNGGSN